MPAKKKATKKKPTKKKPTKKRPTKKPGRPVGGKMGELLRKEKRQNHERETGDLYEELGAEERDELQKEREEEED